MAEVDQEECGNRYVTGKMTSGAHDESQEQERPRSFSKATFFLSEVKRLTSHSNYLVFHNPDSGIAYTGRVLRSSSMFSQTIQVGRPLLALSD